MASVERLAHDNGLDSPHPKGPSLPLAPVRRHLGELVKCLRRLRFSEQVAHEQHPQTPLIAMSSHSKETLTCCMDVVGVAYTLTHTHIHTLTRGGWVMGHKEEQTAKSMVARVAASVYSRHVMKMRQHTAVYFVHISKVTG